MKIRFVQRHVVKGGDGKGPVYEVGQEVDFDGSVAETYAQKYIRRGWAVEVPAAAPVAPVAPLVGERAGESIVPLSRADDSHIGVTAAPGEEVAVPVAAPAAGLTVVRGWRGKYNVIGADGQPINAEPLSKAEADELATKGGA